MTTETKTNNKISWEAEEFRYHPKTAIWYIGFTIIAAGLIIFGAFSKSILTLILFSLIVVLGFFYAHRRPRTVVHEISAQGIVLNNVLYPYSNLKKFWIIYEPPIKTLYVETGAVLNPLLSIYLGQQDPVAVKQLLKEHLKEDPEGHESMIDILTRNLRL